MKKLLRLTSLALCLLLAGTLSATVYAEDDKGYVKLNSSELFLEVGETAELTVVEKEFVYIVEPEPVVSGWRPFQLWRTMDSSVVDFTEEFMEANPSQYYTAVPHYPYDEYTVDRESEDYKMNNDMDMTATVTAKKPGFSYVITQCHDWGSYPIAGVCGVTVYCAGDLDGDSNVLVNDALPALKAALGFAEPSGLELAAGKVTQTGEGLTVDDALAILNMAAGVTQELTQEDYAGIYDSENYGKAFVPGELLVCLKEPYESAYPANDPFSALAAKEFTDEYKSVLDAAGPEVEIPELIADQQARLYRVTLTAGTRKSVLEAIKLLKSNPYVLYSLPVYSDSYYDGDVDGELAQGLCDAYRAYLPEEIGATYGGTVVLNTYFGKYSGCDVAIMSAPDLHSCPLRLWEKEIAGSKFANLRISQKNAFDHLIVVRSGESFLSLQDAYDGGLITAEDVSDICVKHNEANYIEYDVTDALSALRMAVGLNEVTNDALYLYDMDSDQEITVRDALAILRVAVGLGQ